jgi:hypothetical protein
VTSVARKKIVLFLEDSAQEVFISALLERLITEEGKNLEDYDRDILYARGGKSIEAYEKFLEDGKRRGYLAVDLLIVASDGNCNGFTKRKRQLLKVSKGISYPEIVVAVPDPHIERWYLLDANALAEAAGVPIQVVSPTVKCDKNRHKTLLKKAFTDFGLDPPLGGTEYGALVAATMNIYGAGIADHSLRDFVDQVRSWLRRAE